MSELPCHLRPGAKQRRVVCAANRLILLHSDWGEAAGEHLAVAPRHFSPLMHVHILAMVADGLGSRDLWRTSEQGFVDQYGTFMDRSEAFAVAKAAGQILYGPHLSGDQLDSSDLY